jgi:hypothetical protein
MDIQEAITQDFNIMKQLDADEQKARENLFGILRQGRAPEAFDWEFLEQVLELKRRTVEQLRKNVDEVTEGAVRKGH